MGLLAIQPWSKMKLVQGLKCKQKLQFMWSIYPLKCAYHDPPYKTFMHMLMYHLCMFYACHSLCNVYKMLSGAEIVSMYIRTFAEKTLQEW